MALDANAVTSSVTSNDQEKFLASKLIARSRLRLVAVSVCDAIKQPEGAGTTAYFVRYKRMNVPMSPISEGVDPPVSPMSLEQVTVEQDQWADTMLLTDKAMLTTKHPLMTEAIRLLSDNVQRVIDREIQIVWLAGTNVTYGDGSVTARVDITSGMKINDTIIHQTVVTLSDSGVPERGAPAMDISVLPTDGDAAGMDGDGGKMPGNGVGGDNVKMAQGDDISAEMHYAGLAGPQVLHDIQQAGTTLGSWASTAMYANQKKLYNSEVGTWLGVRWIKTNFIPKFSVLGGNTTAVASAAAFGTDTPVVTAVTTGGSLKSTTTFFYKVSRKSKLRGFEEEISIPHSTASTSSSDNESFTFDFTNVDDDYVYNLYFDTVTTGGTGTNATMKLVSENIESDDVITVTANPTTGDTAPENPTYGLIVHPVYFHGDESTNWVGLQNLQVYVTKDEATPSNPVKLRRYVSYKFMAKAMIRDQDRILRLEVVSNFV